MERKGKKRKMEICLVIPPFFSKDQYIPRLRDRFRKAYMLCFGGWNGSLCKHWESQENWEFFVISRETNVPRCFLYVGPSVQFSCSVMSDSLWPHELQHSRLPCPSPTPGVYSNSCSLSQWCHPTISSPIVPFSSHLQSFPASGSLKWVSSSHQVAKVLELQLQLQHQSFQWIFRTYFL